MPAEPIAVERVDVAVVGAGPAGLSAGMEAARLGASVIVVDENSTPGGRLPSQIHPEPGRPGRWTDGPDRAAELTDKARAAGVRLMCGTSVWSASPGWKGGDEWFVGCSPTAPGKGAGEAPSGLMARTVILATGAVQNALPLPGWTLPGVITAGAATSMINCHRVLPGRRVVIVGFNALALAASHLMTACGVDVIGVCLPPVNPFHDAPARPREALAELVRLASWGPGLVGKSTRLLSGLSSRAAHLFPASGWKVMGVPLMPRRRVTAVVGTERVDAVKTMDLTAHGRTVKDSDGLRRVDTVVTSAGLAPLIDLAQVVGCRLVHLTGLGGWVPIHGPDLATTEPGVFAAGSVTGVEGAPVASAQGRLAGLSAAGFLGLAGGIALIREVEHCREDIDQARRRALSLLPNIDSGRRSMDSIWSEKISWC